MEITTSPHRTASTPWGRLVALAVVLGPVSVLVLLPIGLGLQRYVMSSSSMDGDQPGGIPRGAVVYERLVPVDDLRTGDVITFRPPPSAHVDGMVTHRIVAIGPDGIRTQGDANAAPDPWLLQPGDTVVPRVAFALPYVGYAYLFAAEPLLWLLATGCAGLLLLLVTTGSRRARVAPATPVGAGAGSNSDD